MVLERVKKLFKPVEPGTIVRFIQHRLNPPVPSDEEFVSPLRTELKEQLAVKPDIGYAEHCACCRAHQVVDAKISLALDEKEDVEPYLRQVHNDIVENTAEQKRTQTIMQQSSNAWIPSKRFMYGLGATTGALAATTVGKLVLDLYVIPWLTTILPFLLPLIP